MVDGYRLEMRATVQEREAALDDAEIRGFLARDYPRVVNAVALASGSYPAAEDAVQEALVRAWMRSERGERLESLPAWVAAVALNQTRSGWRRAMAVPMRRRHHASSSSTVEEESTMRREISDVGLHRAVPMGLPR